MKYDFVAVDFEIANKYYSSACSIGIAAVCDLKIIKQEYFLIHPPDLEFTLTDIHGISANDVEDAPYFPEIWDKIKHYFDGNIIVAHNAIFDMTVLKACDIEYGLNIPDFIYLCSMNASSPTCCSAAGLVDRAEFLGIKIQDHHNALSDAVTCAQIMIECMKISEQTSLLKYCKFHGDIYVYDYNSVKEQKTFFRKRKAFTKIDTSEIAATRENIDSTHAFYEKNIVFTGELRSMDRKSAMQKVVNRGGVLKNGVTMQTDYLIVGDQDKFIVGSDGMSSKEEKAYKLLSKGFDIKILNEDEFLKLL